MSKKSKRKTDVRSSILVLLLIAILLIASTYAWFTANTQVTISSLNVNVKAQNGLQISADGTNWKTILENTDIDPTNVSGTYSGNTNQIPTVMEPVSSVGTVTNGKMEMFYGQVTSSDSGAWQLSASKETDTKGTEGRYIVFDTFLKVDKESPLTLTSSSGVTYTDDTSKGLENAARIAFVTLGNTAADSDLSTIQGLNTDSTSYIWEPNYDKHTSYAITHAKDTYGDTITSTTGALAYNGIKAEITTPVAIASTDAQYFGAVTPAYTTPTTMTDTQIFTLKAGVTKVRIYMWIEGQDVDCENNASGANIKFDLQFSIPAT